MPIDYPKRPISLFNKPEGALGFEGSYLRPELKVPLNEEVASKVMERVRPKYVMVDPLIAGHAVSQRLIREIARRARELGSRVVLNDVFTYMISEVGADALYGINPDVVVRRGNDKLLAFGVKGEDFKGYLVKYSPQFAKASVLGERLRKALREELEGCKLSVGGLGNVVSLYVSPVVRQYRDLLAVDWRKMRMISLSLLMKGFLVNPSTIFVTHEHKEEWVEALIEAVKTSVKELKPGASIAKTST